MSDIFDPVACTNAGHAGVDVWSTTFNNVAPKFGVPPNLVKAHCLYESGGNWRAIGFTGRGIGLMQLDFGTFLNGTVWNYKAPDGTIVTTPFDTITNITIACRDFIAPAMKAFPDNLDAVVASYNAGVPAVQKELARGGLPANVTFDPWYVRNVTGAFAWFNETSHRVLGK